MAVPTDTFKLVTVLIVDSVVHMEDVEDEDEGFPEDLEVDVMEWDFSLGDRVIIELELEEASMDLGLGKEILLLL